MTLPRWMKPRFFRLWHNPAVSLVVITLAIYSITAGVSLVRQSLAPHFVFLADAFLHSQLELASIPDPPYDLTFFNEHWYVSFPPLPALLLMPIVAIRGLSTSDIAFSVIAGGLCVGAMALALARLNRAIGGFHADGSITWLALLLGFGTPLWYCAALGSVWFTAHVIAAGCLCLYVREVLGDNRPFLAGVWLGLGFLARAPVLLAFPLSLAVRRDRNRSLRDTARFALSLAMGVAPMVLAQAAYNYGRFGSLLEFGYRWMNSPDTLLQRQATWGQFNARFLPENLYTLLIRPPLISYPPLRVTPDPWGMGLLLTCPALILAVLPASARWDSPTPESGASIRELRLGLWSAVGLVQLPSLLYFNTGSYQFGYRFALDWLPLGVVLIAIQCRAGIRGWHKALIAASCLMHLWGVLWMYPNFNGQPWITQYLQLARRLIH